MELEVAKLHWSDVYKDMGRILETYRRDEKGDVVPEGRICKISVNSRQLSLRGQTEHGNPTIEIDEKTKRLLSVEVGRTADFHIRPVLIVGQFLWAWRASDPAYRLAARVGLASIVLSTFEAIAGIVSIIAKSAR